MAVRRKQHDLYCTYMMGMFALGTGFVVVWVLAIREFMGLGFSPAAVPCAKLICLLLFQLAVCKSFRGLMAKFILHLSLLCFCSVSWMLCELSHHLSVFCVPLALLTLHIKENRVTVMRNGEALVFFFQKR